MGSTARRYCPVPHGTTPAPRRTTTAAFRGAMSQSILQPGVAPNSDDWDHDSYQEGSWVTDAGNGSVSKASDGDSLDNDSARRKGKKKKKKKKVVRSGIHALLKECRLEEFEQKLLDYGLENVEDIAEEEHAPPSPPIPPPPPPPRRAPRVGSRTTSS